MSVSGRRGPVKEDCSIARPWYHVESMISVIISAYNEASRIGRVLEPVLAWERPHELVVVDDGSWDGTAEVAASYGAPVVRLEKNGGKSNAMARGVAATSADIILFLDADSIGLRVEHLEQLVKPVVEDSVDMCVGVRDRGWLITEFSRRFLPLISGDRAVKREGWDLIAEAVSPKDRAGWKIEMALNYTVRSRKRRMGTVYLHGLQHTIKEEKRGLEDGFKARMVTTRDVAEATADLYLSQDGMTALAQQKIVHYPSETKNRP